MSERAAAERSPLLAPAASGRPRPYLAGPLRTAFDAWLGATVARHGAGLEFREIRKGVQALTSLYVERREGADLGARALEGRGKRAAVVTYYAPLHFLAVAQALLGIGPERFGRVRRVADVGAGSGAAGAAAASVLGADRVLAIDRSGFALGEARHTYAAFGLLADTRRGRLPAALPRPERGDLWVLGWSVNELAEPARAALGAALGRAVAAGVRLLQLEPLAGTAVPWWRPWANALAAHGVDEGTLKVRLALPEWIARLDRAAGLDHGVVGARVLAGPLEPGGAAALHPPES